MARTGSPWRGLPEGFGKRSCGYRQFRRWTLAGLWEGIQEALNESGLVPATLQMIDITSIRLWLRHLSTWPTAALAELSSCDMVE
jgi:transposase